MRYRNKWEKLLLTGWPTALALPPAQTTSCEEAPLDEVWDAISFKAEDEYLDSMEAAHLILKEALGPARVRAARKLVLSGGKWDDRTLYMCWSAAIAFCRNEGESDAEPTRAEIAAVIRQLVVEEDQHRAERNRQYQAFEDEMQAVETAVELRWLANVRPFNRLPC